MIATYCRVQVRKNLQTGPKVQFRVRGNLPGHNQTAARRQPYLGGGCVLIWRHDLGLVPLS